LLEWCLKGMNDLNAKYAPYHCQPHWWETWSRVSWERTRRSRSAILFGKKMRHVNQISRTYSYESTKINIWFGACKMRRLNRALFTANVSVVQSIYKYCFRREFYCIYFISFYAHKSIKIHTPCLLWNTMIISWVRYDRAFMTKFWL